MGVILTYAVMLGFKDPLVDEDDPNWDRPGFAIDNKLIEDAEPYFTILFTVRARALRRLVSAPSAPPILYHGHPRAL